MGLKSNYYRNYFKRKKLGLPLCGKPVRERDRRPKDKPEDPLDGDSFLVNQAVEVTPLSDEDTLLVCQQPSPSEDWAEAVRNAAESHSAKEVCHGALAC